MIAGSTPKVHGEEARVIDFILGLILIGFALKGLMTGLVRTVVTVAAVAAAWAVSSAQPMLAAPVAAQFVGTETVYYPLVARLATWVGAFAAVQLVGFFVTGLFEKVGLGGADRVGGLLLGTAAGVAVGCLPLAVLYAIPPLYHWDQTQATIERSFFLRSYTPIVRMFAKVPPRPKAIAGKPWWENNPWKGPDDAFEGIERPGAKTVEVDVDVRGD